MSSPASHTAVAPPSTPYAQILHEITLDLLGQRDVDELLGRIVAQATRLLSAVYGEILLLEEEDLVMRAHTPNTPFGLHQRALRNEAMLAWQAVDTQQPVWLDDYTAWAGRTVLYEGMPLTAAADFPIMNGETCLGVLAVARTAAHHPFNAEDIQWGTSFSQLVALALVNAQLHATAAQELAERTQAEATLRQTAANLAQAQAIGHMGNWAWDVQTQESTWSDEHYQIFGLSPTNPYPTRQLFRQAIHPQDEPKIEATLQRALAGAPYNVEYRIFRPDGELRYLHSWARMITDEEGQPIRFIGVVQDITERKQVEQTIEQYLAELKMLTAEQAIILQNTAAAIFMQRQGQIVWGNAAAERLTGYTQEEARPLPPHAFHASIQAHAAFHDLVAKRFDEGDIVTTEIQLRRKDGTLRWVEITGQAINPPYSFEDGILWIMHDIEERKRAEAERQAYAEQLALARDQALRASDYKSQLLSKVGHELRTPLAGILGYAELLQDELAEEAKPHHTRFIQHIVRSARHLDGLINDLLDQAQIEQGLLKINPAPFFLPNMVSFLDGVLAPSAIQKGLEFSLEPDPTLPPVLLGDERRIRQIIINLTNNAIKFTATGQVRVQLTPTPPQGWQITVRDTGIGIPPTAQAKIFDSFWQVNSYEQRGYGLGLSIVAHLVRLMDGHITVESELGRGSTFTVWLPLAVPTFP